MADAQIALKSAQNKKLRKREIRAEFCRTQKAELGEGVLECSPAVADPPKMCSRLRLTIRKKPLDGSCQIGALLYSRHKEQPITLS